MQVRHLELVREANVFLVNNYNTELEIPIEFNSRLKSCLGKFLYRKTNEGMKPIKIQMSVKFMMSFPKENIFDVLHHELVHYALCKQGMPESKFADGAHYFENELKRLSVSRTRTYSYDGNIFSYECDTCHNKYEFHKKLPVTTICNCSIHSHLIFIGESQVASFK